MYPKWLDWAGRLQAIAQNGLLYTQNHFDIERYQAVRQVAAEMVAAGSTAEVERVTQLFSGEEGYATPKVDVRGVLFRDGKVLLVQEWSDGGWTLPGGWADIGASPSENVVREIREETGFEARAVKLLAVYDRNKHPHTPFVHHVYKMFFLCEIVGGQAATSAETLAVAFFGRDEIPPLSVQRVTAGQIERFFEHYQHPEWPTDFD